MRPAIIALLLILCAFSYPYPSTGANEGASVPGTAAMQHDAYGIPGLWWDERLWTPIVIPDDQMVMCRGDSTGSYRCWVIPPASLLFLPVPQED